MKNDKIYENHQKMIKFIEKYRFYRKSSKMIKNVDNFFIDFNTKFQKVEKSSKIRFLSKMIKNVDNFFIDFNTKIQFLLKNTVFIENDKIYENHQKYNFH